MPKKLGKLNEEVVERSKKKRNSDRNIKQRQTKRRMQSQRERMRERERERERERGREREMQFRFDLKQNKTHLEKYRPIERQTDSIQKESPYKIKIQRDKQIDRLTDRKLDLK